MANGGIGSFLRRHERSLMIATTAVSLLALVGTNLGAAWDWVDARFLSPNKNEEMATSVIFQVQAKSRELSALNCEFADDTIVYLKASRDNDVARTLKESQLEAITVDHVKLAAVIDGLLNSASDDLKGNATERAKEALDLLTSLRLASNSLRNAVDFAQAGMRETTPEVVYSFFSQAYTRSKATYLLISSAVAGMGDSCQAAFNSSDDWGRIASANVSAVIQQQAIQMTPVAAAGPSNVDGTLGGLVDSTEQIQQAKTVSESVGRVLERVNKISTISQ